MSYYLVEAVKRINWIEAHPEDQTYDTVNAAVIARWCIEAAQGDASARAALRLHGIDAGEDDDG